nr:PREDICTED: toll-like receptor 3 isoform X1 [Lepisosteus oculatus]
MILFLVIVEVAFFTPEVCHADQKKTHCEIKNRKADCTHLKLQNVPSYLPENITALDLSHNQLKTLPSSALSRYHQLYYLDAGFNSIQAIDPQLCLTLPQLQVLKLYHNEVHVLTEAMLQNCTHLTELYLASNRLKLKGEPFKCLQSLKRLDVSRNDLTSAKLGTHPQLLNLEELILSGNAISVLKADDFSYLSNASLKILKLSALPLKKFEPGCFQCIGRLSVLVMDGSKLGHPLMAKLCSELSETKIRSLSLQDTSLLTLLNTTFKGLQSTNLTSMDLSKNEIPAVQRSSFQWLHSLENLSLAENNFKRFTKDMFIGLGSLKFLNLTKSLKKHKSSSYPVIDDFAFQNLLNLEFLAMESNAFREITGNTFTGLKSLKYLSLSHSYFNLKTVTNVTFSSLAQSPLKILDLTKTGISYLDVGAFFWLRNLSKVYMGQNKISQVLGGREFEGLNNIEEIFLSYNKKITLTPSSFNYTRTLRTLMLGSNLIDSLDLHPCPFQPLGNLTVLDLSNNNLANINAGLFSGLHDLKILKLQHNNLARLWKKANPGGPVLFLKDVPQLEVLQLDSNGFDEIPVDGFKGLFHLLELDLGLNYLNVLPDNVFNDLTSVRVLKLQKNFITSVKETVFGPVFRNLSVLHIEKNPFDCTCDSVLWFVNWLNVTNASVPQLSSQYVCNTPPKYYNSSLVLFDTSPCQDQAPFKPMFVTTSSFLLTFMAMALLIHFQGWRIQFFWNVLGNRILGYKEVDLGENRFEYDAYIVHAQEDWEWVERNLTPLEENPFTFCFEDRDFLPGTPHLENIVETIRQCRKIVFVVTEALLKDPLCRRFTVHHALHQVIEESRDSIVLIFLDDIPDHKLNHCLYIRRGMLNSRCILNWPLQRTRIPAFHQHLKVALGLSNRVH